MERLLTCVRPPCISYALVQATVAGGFRGWYTARWSVAYNRGGAYLERAWLPRRATFGGKGGGHAAGGRPPRSIWVLKVYAKCKPQRQP